MTSNETNSASIRRAYERHLDLLLAEELCCNSAFARFLFERALGADHIPYDDRPEVTVTISDADDLGADEGAAGETDVLAEANFSGQRLLVLIEDKLDAALQPNQISRYLRRAELHANKNEVTAAGALIIAPEAYLTSKTKELQGIKRLAVDEIADWMTKHATSIEQADPNTAKRLHWRAKQLIQLREARSAPSPDHEPSMKARDFIIDRLREIAPHVEPRPKSMRTANQGWLYFASPDAIIFKVVHGYVDIYLRDIWPDDKAAQQQIHQDGPWPANFHPTRDTVGNYVLRCTVRPDAENSQTRPIQQINEIELSQGTDACAAAASWIANQPNLA